MPPVNWINILFVATMGATGTIGLRSGIFPLAKTITRWDAPTRYWLAIGGCFMIVLLSIAGTIAQVTVLRR
jgi:hypothetical protein